MKALQTKVESIIEKIEGHWAVACYDLNTNASFEINGQDQFKAQSIIKVPIMAAVFAAYEQKKISLSDKIELKREDIVGGAGVLPYLTVGLELTIYDLMTLMIIQSDNTATNMLIDIVGFEAIQAIMEQAGMKNSCFRKKLAIYPAVEEDVENYISVADMNLFLTKLAKGKIVSGYSSRRMISIMKNQQYRNALPFYFPEPIESDVIGVGPKWELAHKTGWDTGYQHDSGILYVGDRSIAITVLSQKVNNARAILSIAEIGKEVFDFVNE